MNDEISINKKKVTFGLEKASVTLFEVSEEDKKS